MTNTRKTTVNSDLARVDARDGDSPRCQSTHRLGSALAYALPAGTVLRCERPVSRHRVHEALGWVQW